MSVAFRTLGVIAVLLGLLLAFLPGGAELRDTRDIDTTPDLVGGNVPFRITALVTGVVVGVGLWWLGSTKRPRAGTTGDGPARRAHRPGRSTDGP